MLHFVDHELLFLHEALQKVQIAGANAEGVFRMQQKVAVEIRRRQLTEQAMKARQTGDLETAEKIEAALGMNAPVGDGKTADAPVIAIKPQPVSRKQNGKHAHR